MLCLRDFTRKWTTGSHSTIKTTSRHCRWLQVTLCSIFHLMLFLAANAKQSVQPGVGWDRPWGSQSCPPHWRGTGDTRGGFHLTRVEFKLELVRLETNVVLRGRRMGANMNTQVFAISSIAGGQSSGGQSSGGPMEGWSFSPHSVSKADPSVSQPQLHIEWKWPASGSLGAKAWIKGWLPAFGVIVATNTYWKWGSNSSSKQY